ncbi:MAG: hypothetical protein EHM13_11135, partial [Acidobacteria bacterium]
TPNPERAKKLLADAGYPSGFKTSILAIPTFPTMVAGAQVISAQLKRVGIEAQIVQQEYGVWIKNIIKPNFNFDLSMQLTNGEADPDSLFYRRFHGSEQQWTNGGDPEVDALLDQGRATIDKAKRKELYDKAQRLMVERALAVWTFSPDLIEIVQNTVRYEQHFTSLFYNFRTVALG